MKEQDAAHSFEKTLKDVELKGNFYAMEYAPFMMKVFEKFSLYTPHETTATGGTELTRLRSELQQAKHDNECLKDLLLKEQIKHSDKDYTVIKNDELDRLISKLNQLTSELQQKDEVIKELLPIMEDLYSYSVSTGYSSDGPYTMISDAIERAKESVKSKAN